MSLFKKDKKTNSNNPAQSQKSAQEIGELAIDAYQTDSHFCVRAPIAGVNSEDINISVENGILTIKGERKEADGPEEKKYYFQECYWGPFIRQIILPEGLDTEKIEASLQKGILIVEIPKLEEQDSPKKISVEPIEEDN